jgi:hypothetical protein
MLHQESALGAPCLDTMILALRRRALAGRRILRTDVIRHFDITLRLATPDIMLTSADAFAVVVGGCTGRAHGCKAKQGSRGKDCADGCFLTPTVVRFWDLVQRESLPMQDEPEGRTGFQHKMSLKD